MTGQWWFVVTVYVWLTATLLLSLATGVWWFR